MLKFIKSLQLRWSDLAILIGFGIFVVFASYGQLFMYHQDPNNVPFSLTVAIILFVIGFLAFCFVIGEGYFRKELPALPLSLFFLLIILVGLVATTTQPHTYIYDESHTIMIEAMNKTVFAFEFILMMMFIYCGFFIYSKRFPNFKFLIVLCYIAFIFAFVVAIYSYIAEGASISNYFQVLFGYKEGEMTPIASFLIHPNSVGMVMLLAILMAFIANSIKRHWWYYLFILFFFTNILFTHCRGSLFLSVLLIPLYVYYRLFTAHKNDMKMRNIYLIVFSSVIALFFLFVVIVLAGNGEYLPHLYKAASMITNTGSLVSRLDIYETCFSILNNGGWLIGKGFGTFNLILSDLKAYTNYVLPTHNAVIAMLAEGGIVFTIAYFALLIYTAIFFIRSYRENKQITFAIGVGITAFFIYSIVETIQYIMYFFIFLLLMAYQILDKQNNKKDTLEIAVDTSNM